MPQPLISCCVETRRESNKLRSKNPRQLQHKAINLCSKSKLWHLSPPLSSSSFPGFMLSPPLEYYHSTLWIFRTPPRSRLWDMRFSRKQEADSLTLG
ncbi:hypothetical protein SADUNF_Sadunf08G0028700 [Salix dunnii]|uniref:Uncharacterized protein n=1 Tax=Salix dunnii TaxID=1413687 RepID=A0A835MT65_9ROSI|nr:hypothetical protein SADUNF_Sadunf08G0028700 [Salix dunnii]